MLGILDAERWVRSRCVAYFGTAFERLSASGQQELVNHIISHTVSYTDSTWQAVQAVGQLKGDLQLYVDRLRESRLAEEAWFRRTE